MSIKRFSDVLNSDIRWTLRAICKDAARYNLCFLHVTDDVMVCVDGRRMHIAPNKLSTKGMSPKELILEPGSYRVITNKKKEVVLELVDSDIAGTFPNFEWVTPQKNTDHDFGVKARADRAQGCADLGTAYNAVNKHIDGGMVVSSDFLKDAVVDSGIEWTQIAVKDSMSPILFKSNDGHKAVVMPIRL